MNSFKKLLPFLILILTFSYCSNSYEIEEEQEEEEEITYATVAPFYPIDFEVDGNGAEWSWAIFENGTNTVLEVVENPYKSGINTSETVAKFTALREGMPYAGCETKHGEDVGAFKFDDTNSIVKILVYKTSISDVALKFAEYAAPGVGAEAQPEVKVANTKINEWEELTFDLSGSIGKGATMVIDQIIIFPDFTSRTTDNVIYFDNITFGNN
jgi:PIN domain nuclease of toxin-antitoxin system